MEAGAPVKLNLGSGAHPLGGFVNLDKDSGWQFEDGLRYKTSSVAAVTVSHSLMYVDIDNWRFVFAEIKRVLKRNGVVRVTEDDAISPDSARYGGFHDAVTLTSPHLVLQHMRDVGLEAQVVGPGETLFKDETLIQQWHGAPPKVFFVEGVKS